MSSHYKQRGEKINIDPNREYLGKVIDNKDPNCAGRCKVKVYGVLDEMDENYIPWAMPRTSGMFAGNGAGSLSVPKEGTEVRVRFDGGRAEAPEWFAVQKIDRNMVNEIKNDYIGAHVILYDHDADLSIKYQKKSGIICYFGGSFIQITPEGMITINHAGNTSIIQLDGDRITLTANSDITVNAADNVNLQSKVVNVQGSESVKIKGDHPNECAVNGHVLFNYLNFLAKIVDAKYCATPTVCEMQLNSIKNALLNEHIVYT